MSKKDSPEIISSAATILKNMMIQGQRAKIAHSPVLDWCIKNKYVEKSKDEYIITMEGMRYYEESKENARIITNTSIWRDEALTGITKAGKRSTIERGALPSNPKVPVNPDDPLEALVASRRAEDLKSQIAGKLGIPIPKMLELWSEGLIRICKGGEEPHLGRFQRGRGTCADCRRKQRNQNKRRKE